jgi:hypothetical protein
MKKPWFYALFLAISSASLLAQEAPFDAYSPTKSFLTSSDRVIQPDRARFLRLKSPDKLIETLRPEKGTLSKPRQIVLLAPDGQAHTFVLTPYQMVHSSIRRVFPNLLTARGYDRNRPWVSIVVDWTPKGFHASIRSGEEGQWYIDPLVEGNDGLYQSYFTRDLSRASEEFPACITEEYEDHSLQPEFFGPKLVGDCQLREYQLALACTGEYASFHGSSDAEVFGAMVTAINRVNQIFGQDLALQLTLVNQVDMAGNVDLVYNDPTTDPYTNNNFSLLIAENQTTCDAVIGTGNYDVGHIFTTTGGGIATISSTCQNGFKARGASGLNNPVGDPFYVDLVAHEFGHQFGARHSFNSSTGNCSQRTGSQAYEPGSGSTVMSYAGICGSSANVQTNSDPYFHGSSMASIANYVELNFGASCATTLSTANTAPAVSAGGNYSIPTNTPFVLTASANDTDGDFLTYCWEQADLGPAVNGLPSGTESDSPLFRSFPPTTSPERYFPELSSLASGNTDWEVLPRVAREMSFIVTARDFHSAGGGNFYGCPVQDGMSINVVNTGSQYAVLSPNGGENWRAGSNRTVQWNVAGTTGNGINCANVDIVLSTNGGRTFDQVLAASVPNNGSRSIVVPIVTETDARIMVRCSDNIFFDISDANFRIEQNDYDFRPSTDTGFACDGTNTLNGYGLILESLQGYTGTVDLSTLGLPNGVTADFSRNPVPLGSGELVSVTVSLTGVSALPPGSYPFTVRATDGNDPKDQSFSLVTKAPLATAALVSPAEAEFLDPAAAVFDWEDVPNATAYEWRLYDNPSGVGSFQFSTLTRSVANFGPNLPVEAGDIRYWGVIAIDADCNPISQSFSVLSEVRFGTAPALPVEWLTFRAAPRGKTAHLQWTVNQDEEHRGFMVQRRTDEANPWEDLRWIDAQSGSETVTYQHTDRDVREGSTYYYRIRQEDRDGQTDFSPIRSVSFDGPTGTVAFPNPTEDLVNLRTNGEYTIYRLYDTGGRLLREGPVRGGMATIPITELPAGVYQIQVAGPAGGDITRVVKR